MRRFRLGTDVVLRAILVASFVLASALASTSADAQIRIPGEDTAAAVNSVLDEGMEFESHRQWAEALVHYEDALKEFPSNESLRQRHDTAKLHYDLGRRYNDVSYRKTLLTLKPQSALDVYSEVLLKIDSHYVHQTNWRELVDRGTRALDIALTEEAFASRHLHEVDPARLEAFRRDMRDMARVSPANSRRDARMIAQRIASMAERQVGIPQPAVIFEYVASAAGGLDAYSTYLTPDQLKDVYSQIDGNFVGLGIELKADEGTLLIVSVIPNSPAARGGIRGGDRILSVDGHSTRNLSTDEAATLLQGVEGSLVQIDVLSTDETRRQMQLRRQHVEVPSIENARIVDAAQGVAYLKLSTFQRTTARDLDTALWKLHRQGMKSLIVDVRGNPGGLLTASVDVADKFVRGGTIVSTRGRNKHEDFNYPAHAMATWSMPLAVLIDGNSASASEIFAASIRDHHRGVIVGQRSYGKGSVQGIFPLNRVGAGLRLTTAKFYGPHGGRINKVGVEPNLVVAETARPTEAGIQPEADADAVLDAAVESLRRYVAQR